MVARGEVRSQAAWVTPERLRRRARRCGLTIAADVVGALVSYLELLYRWNQKINLTSLRDPDEAIDRLVMEPLLAARHVPAGAHSVIDIGSGGGSPALPLKLVLPNCRLVMVESKARKAAFLQEAVRHLALSEVRVEVCRYEELLTRPDLHEAHDLLTLRAVRVESRALMSLQAFLKPGGLLFLFRGPGGPDAPTLMAPPLTLQGTWPLVESLRSRLLVFKKSDM